MTEPVLGSGSVFEMDGWALETEQFALGRVWGATVRDCVDKEEEEADKMLSVSDELK